MGTRQRTVISSQVLLEGQGDRNPTRKTERDKVARGGCSETLRVRKGPQVPKQNHAEKGQVQSHEL